MTDTLHTIGDWIAATITITTILKLLPAIAALMSILWTLARFYDRWAELRSKPQNRNKSIANTN